jgi:hypothetical protein
VSGIPETDNITTQVTYEPRPKLLKKKIKVGVRSQATSFLGGPAAYIQATSLSRKLFVDN